MADQIKKEGDINKKEGDINRGANDPAMKHQITCNKCGMVYEIRYISESCRMVEGEGYYCMNCNTVLDLAAG